MTNNIFENFNASNTIALLICFFYLFALFVFPGGLFIIIFCFDLFLELSVFKFFILTGSIVFPGFLIIFLILAANTVNRKNFKEKFPGKLLGDIAMSSVLIHPFFYFTLVIYSIINYYFKIKNGLVTYIFLSYGILFVLGLLCWVFYIFIVKD